MVNQNKHALKKTLWFSAGGILVVVAAAWLVKTAVSNRVVASATASNGIQFAIVQEFNWNLEMFTTAAVYKVPGAGWKAFYYEHEDTLWLKGAILTDERARSMTVFRRGRVVATFRWDDETFTHYYPDARVMVSTNGGVVLPSGWVLGMGGMGVWRRQK